jgi:hypothetical protein
VVGVITELNDNPLPTIVLLGYVDEEYDKLNVLELRVVELKIILVPLPL